MEVNIAQNNQKMLWSLVDRGHPPGTSLVGCFDILLNIMTINCVQCHLHLCLTSLAQ